jgi:hypothetical protein
VIANKDRISKLEKRAAALERSSIDHDMRLGVVVDPAMMGIHEVRIASLEAQFAQALEAVEVLQQQQISMLNDMRKLIKAIEDFARGEKPDAAA